MSMAGHETHRMSFRAATSVATMSTSETGMTLGERLKLLRRERGWSQDEFAHHAQIDGRQVSRYENGKVTPSIEVMIKIARAYNVSLDFLLIDDAERRPLAVPTSRLAQRVLEATDLSEEDEKSLLHVLEAIEAKNKLKKLAANVG